MNWYKCYKFSQLNSIQEITKIIVELYKNPNSLVLNDLSKILLDINDEISLNNIINNSIMNASNILKVNINDERFTSVIQNIYQTLSQEFKKKQNNINAPQEVEQKEIPQENLEEIK